MIEKSKIFQSKTPSSGLLLWNDAKSGVKRSENFESSPNVVPNFERVISRHEATC